MPGSRAEKMTLRAHERVGDIFFGGFREVAKAQPLLTQRLYSMPCVILCFGDATLLGQHLSKPLLTSRVSTSHVSLSLAVARPFGVCVRYLPWHFRPACVCCRDISCTSRRARTLRRRRHARSMPFCPRRHPRRRYGSQYERPSLLPCRHLFLRGDNFSQ